MTEEKQLLMAAYMLLATSHKALGRVVHADWCPWWVDQPCGCAFPQLQQQIMDLTSRIKASFASAPQAVPPAPASAPVDGDNNVLIVP